MTDADADAETKTNDGVAPGRGCASMLALAMIAWVSCDARQERNPSPDRELAASLGRALATACPIGDDPSDEDARNACADKLTELELLRGAMSEPFAWGGQTRGYDLDEGTTRFNSRVWRRMYLSTFMFGPGSTIEHVDGGAPRTILHVPVRFRHAMPTGAYPYPFWHAPKKWSSYSYSTMIHFIVQEGRLIGALRASEQDATRPKIAHAWNGSWRWGQGAGEMPYVSLYDYLLSRDNPHLAELDDAYRKLEAQMRQSNCMVCHSPDNRGDSQQLELLSYPNQALAGRSNIVAQLLDDEMPPENDLGIAAGISDDAREHLLQLALRFEAVGTAALSWEGEATGN